MKKKKSYSDKKFCKKKKIYSDKKLWEKKEKEKELLLRCWICLNNKKEKYIFASDYSLRRHMKTLHCCVYDGFKCFICETSHESYIKWKIHLNEHTVSEYVLFNKKYNRGKRKIKKLYYSLLDKVWQKKNKR